MKVWKVTPMMVARMYLASGSSALNPVTAVSQAMRAKTAYGAISMMAQTILTMIW